MSVLSLIPLKNVELVDIRETLNGYGGIADNNASSFFKSSAKINMWSRYKPVVHTSLFLDGDMRWKGANEQCGLTIPQYSSQSAIRSALQNGTAMWSYTPPTGGTSQPLRIGDFRGYNPEAVNPIGQMADEYIVNTDGYVFDIQIEVIVGSEDSEYNLMLEDISVDGVKLTEMYLGVYMIPASGSGYIFTTSSSPIGTSDSLTMTVQGDSGTKGEYTAYMFLSTTSQADGEQDGTFISLNKEAQQITLTLPEDLHSIEVYGLWNKSGTAFDYEVTITNNNSTSVTFKTVNVYLVRASSYEDLFGDNEVVAYVPLATSVTVAANGTQKYTGTKTYTMEDGYYYGLYASSIEPTIITDVTELEMDLDEDA